MLLVTSSCAMPPVESVAVPNQAGALSLRSLAQAQGFGIGSAVTLKGLRKDERYRQVLVREFTQIMPENAMKFNALQPQRDRFNFAAADEIVDFANDRGLKVFGHTLVWQRALPAWLKAGNWTREELLDILHKHITTAVSRYRGRVFAWDVVNEALSTDSSLRDLIWLRGIGPEYIDLAFQWAREADPNARLFYNEYDPSGWGARAEQKVDALYNLIAGMKERGVPIDGIGLQMHVKVSDAPTYEGVKKSLERLAQLDLEIQITETDVRLVGSSDPLATQLATQAQIYDGLIRACLDVPRCNGFWFWGFTDRYSWISGFTGKPDGPLIFDRFYQPKPAYDAIAQALAESEASRP